MTESLDLDAYRPPEAPIEMPYQIIERRREPARSWLEAVTRLLARRARHE